MENIKETTDLDRIKKTLVGISKGDNILDTLLEFERTLDNAQVFAYKNWILGELVEPGKDLIPCRRMSERYCRRIRTGLRNSLSGSFLVLHHHRRHSGRRTPSVSRAAART